MICLLWLFSLKYLLLGSDVAKVSEPSGICLVFPQPFHNRSLDWSSPGICGYSTFFCHFRSVAKSTVRLCLSKSIKG